MNSTQTNRFLETTSLSNEKLISIHLCFQKKVNFKHKFLNHFLRIDLELIDYFYGPNPDIFNAEIKQLSNGRYIESSNYTSKKVKNRMNDIYRYKQANIASTAFQQDSLPKGTFVLEFILSQTSFIF